MNAGLQLLGGATLLYLGAEWLVGGASALALALRVPQLLVGLTVVAFGTSAPEIVVGVEAAASGHGAVALGNVIGSNVANIGLILGSAALIRPARVDGVLRRRELPVMVGSALLVPLLLRDGVLSVLESSALLAAAVLYTAWMVHTARAASTLGRAQRDAVTAARAAEAAGAPQPVRAWRAGLIATLGLLVLLVGGHLFIAGAVASARNLGLSERVVGLTIVALGTSLPELVTSSIAAWRGHSDLAVGNVVGSNIFNVLVCLGAAGLAGPVTAPLGSLRLELVSLLGMTALAALFIRTQRTITRVEGAIALALFVAFVVITLLTA